MLHEEYMYYQKADLEEIETAYDKALDEMLNKINNQKIDVEAKIELIDAFVVAKKTGRFGLLLSTVRKFNLEKIITIDEINKLNYLHYFLSEKNNKGEIKMKAKDFIRKINEIKDTSGFEEILITLEDTYYLTADEVELDSDEYFVEFLESKNLINKRTVMTIAVEDFENLDCELIKEEDYLRINIDNSRTC